MLRETGSEASAGDRLFCVRVPELPTHLPHLCHTREAVQDLHAGLSPGAPGQGQRMGTWWAEDERYSLYLQQIAHQHSQSVCYIQNHKVVNIVLQVLVWGTKHPFTKQETQCWALNQSFLLSNMVKAKTTKVYVSVERNLNVKSVKELVTRQKIIWIVFCLYLYNSTKANTVMMHVATLLYFLVWSSTSAVLVFLPACAWGKWSGCRSLTAGCLLGKIEGGKLKEM